MAETVGPDIAEIQCYIPDGCCGPSPCDLTLDQFVCQLRTLLPEGDVYNNTKPVSAPVSVASKGAITVGCVRVGCEQLIFGGCCPDEIICAIDEPIAPQLAVVDSYAAVTYEAIVALCAMLKELDPCTAEQTLKQWAERFGIEPCGPCEPMWSDKVLAFLICLLLQMRHRVVNFAYLEELARMFGAELVITFAGDFNCGPGGWWTMARDVAVCPHPSTVGEVIRVMPTCIAPPPSINIVIRPGDITTPDNCNLGRVSATLPHDPEMYRAFKCLLPKILPQPAYYCIYEEDIANCISIDEIRDAPKPTPCIVDEIPQPLIIYLNPDHAQVGGPDLTVIVNGANFIPTSIVQWYGVDVPTTYISSTQLSFVVQPSLVGAETTAPVRVRNEGKFSNTVNFRFVQAAIITSPASIINVENTVLAHALTANEPVTWAIVGGVDAAQFEIVGSTLRWLGNGTKDFEAPGSAAGTNTYVVTVRATDASGNTTSQTIVGNVTDVAEGYIGNAPFMGFWPITVTSSGSREAETQGAMTNL